MRILLDESVPRKLAAELPGHDTETVQRRGWAGLKNGALLQAASGEFDIFITADTNIEFQQNTATLPLAVVVLIAVNNRVETLAAAHSRAPENSDRHPAGTTRSSWPARLAQAE